MRKHTSASRPAGIESLETRKLLFGNGHYVPQAEYGHRFDASIDVPATRVYGYGDGAALRTLPFGGGGMYLVVSFDPPSITAAAATTAATDATPAPAPTANAAAESHVPVTGNPAAAATVTVKPAATPADPADATAGVTAATPSDTPAPVPAVADAAPNATRFAFASFGVTADHARPAAEGLASLLSAPARVVTATNTLAIASAAGGRSGNASAATTADADADPVIGVGPTVAGATLAALPGPVGVGQPFWQRLAVGTAAAVLVSANWVVRRRNRRTALAARPMLHG